MLENVLENVLGLCDMRVLKELVNDEGSTGTTDEVEDGTWS